MSLLPMYRRCPKCGEWYSFNPDVGRLGCPKCGLAWIRTIDKSGSKYLHKKSKTKEK